MPRTHRHFLSGYVWHITQRCHRQQFLLKFARDRQTWIRWLYKARKRYGLQVLNYTVTSNHIHLLVKDCGKDEIAASMQLRETPEPYRAILEANNRPLSHKTTQNQYAIPFNSAP